MREELKQEQKQKNQEQYKQGEPEQIWEKLMGKGEEVEVENTTKKAWKTKRQQR